MIVFVVGIYKSGTSAVTTLLEQMGLPSVVEDFRSVSNVTGVKYTYNIRESYEVNLLNNDIIYSTGQTEMYFDHSKMPLTIDHTLKSRIKSVYERVGYNGVIKDPRFIGTLKYWIDELPKEVDYKIVWVIRENVFDVEKSFKKDSWFVNKVDESVGYLPTIEKLNNNLYSQMSAYKNRGIKIDYEFYTRYPNNCASLLYNYLTNNNEPFEIKKIYFTEYYGSPTEVMDRMAKQCPHNIPVWDNLTAVTSQDEADYIIIQDKTNDDIIDESKVIFFGREPKHVPGGYRSGKETYHKILHHENGNTWMPQTWWLNIDFNTLTTLNPTKISNLSVVDSGKCSMSGHNLRLQLINRLSLKYPNDIDVYGKINGNVLPPRDKQNGLLNYRYYLAIENGVTDHYFSEKLCDAMLCLCVPLYIGCSMLEDYFPPNSFIRLDTTKSVDDIVDDIIRISHSDYREQNLDSLIEARNRILYKYNIWPTIQNAIHEG